ncbi:hypothetical protein Dda_8107 [Drechslerella dactyloides]|uniref:Uncharacterized protein n=1 Tax=Drechslerella dactyloides TaxID=74499 RepID=A0AAD6IT95_DREDA|nr:hypothetical protein Dda_8107 [Drechslerella dactyloides]
MAVLSWSMLVGCCGCGRSGESRGEPQDEGSSAVVDLQPLPVELPVAARACAKVRRMVLQRDSTKPTPEQLEALYQEGKELVRLQEAEELKLQHEQEAKAAAPTTVITATEEKKNTATLQPVPRNNNDENVKEPDYEALTSLPPLPPTPVPSDIDFKPLLSTDSQQQPSITEDENTDGDAIDKLAPISEHDEGSPSSAFAPDITEILAKPPIQCVSPPPAQHAGTQTSKKIKTWFQDDRSSIYPSDESSKSFSELNGVHTPRASSPALDITNNHDENKENRGALAVAKIRKVSRNASPGNLLIRPIFEVLEQSRRTSLVLPPPAEPAAEPAAELLVELPHPVKYEPRYRGIRCETIVDDDESIRSLPDPADFEFYDIELTPPASPKPQEVPSVSPFLQGASFLKKEFERIKQRIETGLFDTTSSEELPKPLSPAVIRPPTAPDLEPVTPLRSTKGLRRSPLSVEGLRLPDLAILKGLYGIQALRSPTPRSPLASLSSLNFASNSSLQALGSQNSGILTPKVRDFSSGSLIADRVTAGLPAPPSVEAPADHEAAVEPPAPGLIDNLQKSKETLAKNISSGFSSLLKRFGVKPAQPSSPVLEPLQPQPEQQPQPPVQQRLEQGMSAESLVIATPPLTPTPSNLPLMRQILGQKVEGTLRATDVATASPESARLAMSSGFLTVDNYTDTLSVEYVNEFDGFNWDAPDGKVPWYQNGEYTCEKLGLVIQCPKMPGDEESAKSPYLPEAQSTGASQFTPPVTTSQALAASATDLVASSANAGSVASPYARSLSSSSRSQTRLGSPAKSSEHVPRYDPMPHRDARLSTCGLDLNVERSFYMSYEDRLKRAVKPWMRGRSSTNF